MRNKKITLGNQIFSKSIFSIFYNPTYLIRSKLYFSIEKHAGFLNGKLLDFGCGSKPYRSLFTKVTEYVGLDFAAERSQGKETSTDLNYNGKTIPVENESFDCILSTEVFEHVFDINGTLIEINRVLKPGGYLLITCPFSFPEHEQPYDFARYTSFAIRHLLVTNKFEIIDYTKTGSIFTVIGQYVGLLNYYVINKIPILNKLLFPIFVTPFFLIANFLELVMPKSFLKREFYLNNVVLCKKIPHEIN